MKLPSITRPSLTQPSPGEGRLLGDEYEQSAYFVDSDGNSYEPYSLAWRYLGMYIDCDVEDDTMDEYLYNNVNRQLQNGQQKQEEDGEEQLLSRDLKSGDNKSGDDGNDCARKILWAAYRDPGYRGGSIGEYQFYDWKTDTWDKSTCRTSRCAKMDCHARGSHWQLVGVFKETDGLTDWAEQLFKHEGYCLWDADKEGGGSNDRNQNKNNDDGSGDYDFMSARREKWVSSCSMLYMKDLYGKAVYRDTRPLAGGNMTDALYYDDKCSQRAAMSWPEYIIAWFTYYYSNAENGRLVAQSWMASTQRWNELMTDYKICQPCRAYNKVVTSSDEGQGGGGGGGGHRFLNNDGEGEEEQWGYNCNDDAGYLNCNQCRKFETKTSMELASTSDLERAAKQGTILSIKVDGVIYGKGGYHAVDDNRAQVAAGTILLVMGVMAIVVTLGFCFKKPILNLIGRFKRRQQVHAGNLKETFLESPDEVQEIFHHLQDEISRKNKMIEKQRLNLERLRLELDQERTLREMELKAIRRDDYRNGDNNQCHNLKSTEIAKGDNSLTPAALEECHSPKESYYHELSDPTQPHDTGTPVLAIEESHGPHVVIPLEPSGSMESPSREINIGSTSESEIVFDPASDVSSGSETKDTDQVLFPQYLDMEANGDIPAQSFGSVSTGSMERRDNKSDFADIPDSTDKNLLLVSELANVLGPLDIPFSAEPDTISDGQGTFSDYEAQGLPLHQDNTLHSANSAGNPEEREATSSECTVTEDNNARSEQRGIGTGELFPADGIESATATIEVENESPPPSEATTDPENGNNDQNNEAEVGEAPSFSLGVV